MNQLFKRIIAPFARSSTVVAWGLLLLLQPAWAQGEADPAPEVQALAKDSKVQFYQPCPGTTVPGNVIVYVEPENLVIKAFCYDEEKKSTFVQSTVPNTLLETDKPLILERIFSRNNLFGAISYSLQHRETAMMGDADKACAHVAASAKEGQLFPKSFFPDPVNWQAYLEYFVDSACKVLSFQVGNWIALVPANRSDEFKLYGIHFEVTPGEYRHDSRLAKKVVSMPNPSKIPKGAKLLNKNGKVQIFRPCPDKAGARWDDLRVDSKNLTFNVVCSKVEGFELKAIRYPNTLLTNDKLVVLSLTRFLNPRMHNPFVTESIILNSQFRGLDELVTFNRPNGGECLQIETEVREHKKWYPDYLGISTRDPRESVAYSMDEECRGAVVNVGNLFAVMPADTEEEFMLYGIKFKTRPISARPAQLEQGKPENAQP